MRQISTLTWAERFVTLDGTRFDRRNYPQFIDIAETIDRRRGCTFLLRFPPQTGKSLLMQLRLLRCVAVAPVRSLWYCKTNKDAENFSDEKFRGQVETIQNVRAKLPFDVDARGTKTLFRFVDAPLSLLSADVVAHRNQRSGQDLYLDETWQFEPGAIAEIRARSDSYEKTRRIIMGETAPDEEAESEVIWKRSSRKTWHCVCPLCRERVELVWGDAKSQEGFKWDEIRGDDGLWDTASAAKTVRFVCPSCHESLPWSENLLKKLNDTTAGACYLPKNGNPDDKTEGWTANAFVFRSWPTLIGEFLTACNAKRLGDLSLFEEFTKKKLCRAWSDKEHYKKQTELPILPYKLREDWPDEATFANSKQKMRFVWVDVQQQCYWALCRKWASDGRSRLHDFRQLFTAHAIKEFADECGVPTALVWVDNAYDPKQKGQFWGRSTKLCGEYGFNAANAIGEKHFLHSDGVRRIYSEPHLVDAWQGEAQRGTKPLVPVINYSSNGAKHMLHFLRQQKHPMNGEWLFSIPEDATAEYKKQAYAEVLVEKKHPRGGKMREWVKIEDDNHAFDLEAGQVMSANIFGLVGASAVTTAAESQENKATVEAQP